MEDRTDHCADRSHHTRGAVQTIPEVPNLDILVSGPVPPFPTEMLSSEAMRSCSSAAESFTPTSLSTRPGALGHRRRHPGARGRCRRARRSSRQIEQAYRPAGPRSSAALRRPNYRHRAECRRFSSPEYYGYYGYSGTRMRDPMPKLGVAGRKRTKYRTKPGR